ncbi:uncharacterized protein C11orf52 homolog [Xenopus laevis]|uniref:Uncharacterized protein C11orf52 homolog n=2 Tax=Xenopus laevis TaxID=8355 RepID=A0A1L8FLP1_XENLA|nr:uncharacterized protein C11orf52 homolog [Xenopus laevis]OCT72513.1 hypothetical protein XELAEV_18035493mg [Xenopus laevis]
MGNVGSSKLWPTSLGGKKKEKSSGSKKRQSTRPTQKLPTNAPTYDTVAEVPVYAVVDKTKHKKPKEENVHYADIEVLRRPTTRTAKRKPEIPPKPEVTEYASINFPTAYNPIKGTLV